MFTSLARLAVRRPVVAVVAWSVAAAGFFVLAIAGVGQGGLFDRVQTGEPIVKGTDSHFVLEQNRAAQPTDRGLRLTLELSGVDTGDGASSAVARAVDDAAARVAQRANVALVTTPYAAHPGPAFSPSIVDATPSGGSSPLLAVTGDAFLVVVYYAPLPDTDAALAEHHEVIAMFDQAVGPFEPNVELRAYSDPLIVNDFNTQIEDDLVTGETVALPVALVVMVLVFGGFLAASAPIIGALASIAGGMAVLFGFSYPIDLDQSAINVVTVLGIGLSIDYGLLIVSRYREELAKRHDDPAHDAREASLVATMETAGRTVFFSGVTVGIAVSGMLVFSPEIMRSFGGAAVGVVLMALLTALTLVPAVVFLMGHRLARPSVVARIPGLRTILRHTADVTRDEGAFSTLARQVQRKPWWVIAAVTIVLLAFASPLLHLQVRNSGVEMLPQSNERRQVLSTFADRYPPLAGGQITVLADTSPATLDAWMEQVAAIDGVQAITPAKPQLDLSSAGVLLTNRDGGGPDAVRVVRTIRDLDSDFRVYVGGQPAAQVDFVDAIRAGAPTAVGLIVFATLVLLFLMTGSLLVPIKTLIINSLSLAATLGVVAWVFQQGHLEGVIGFSNTGGVETYVLVLIAAFGFGLAMDYEVFLLARIKELADAGVPNDDAVRIGLQRSGRIITSAAAVVVLVFLGFAFGKLLVIKEVGVGLGFAVLLDASLVRMLLVPATMTLLGEWNWWSPAPLRRLYDRAALKH